MDEGPFPIVKANGKAVNAIGYPASSAPPLDVTILLAHGAGAGQRHPYMIGMAERLRVRGVSVVTFDFPYIHDGKKLPDKNDVLEDCFAAVFEAVRGRSNDKERRTPRLFAGGKSMGGRIASQVAAKGAIAPAGLVFLGYPLHPPGKPTQLRDTHLPLVAAPMLFVQGTRDVFGTADELLPLVRKLSAQTQRARAGRSGASAVLHAVEGGDHSHAVLKRGPLSQDQVFSTIADAIVGWVKRTSHTPARNV